MKYQTDSHPPYTRAQSLANALERIAEVNHYMIGIVEQITESEILDALEILNHATYFSGLSEDSDEFRRLSLAMDIGELCRRDIPPTH